MWKNVTSVGDLTDLVGKKLRVKRTYVVEEYGLNSGWDNVYVTTDMMPFAGTGEPMVCVGATSAGVGLVELTLEGMAKSRVYPIKCLEVLTEEQQPARGDKVIAWNFDKSEYVETVFLHYELGASSPYLCVAAWDTDEYEANREFDTDVFMHVELIPEPEVKTAPDVVNAEINRLERELREYRRKKYEM